MNELRQKPFALIGVNGLDHSPEELKRVMIREQLSWRSFADHGAISHQWNSPATPTYYVIDHKGTIRRKWVGSPGARSMDAALEDLIREAEARVPE